MIKVHKDIPLAPFTTMRIGGNADYLAEIETKQELQEAVQFAKNQNLPLFFLGGGSNILFSDAGFRGLILRMKNKKIEMRGGNIWAEAGVLISELVRFAKQQGKDLSGFLALPGTWGGAVTGNAGIPGWEAKDTLVQAEVFDIENNQFQTVPNDWFEYEYRNSRLHKTSQKKWIVWAAEQTAPDGDPEEIEVKCKAVLQMRKEKQPWGLSAGSFFKNLPESADFPKPKNAAGWLLEQVGAKKEQVGDAVVSQMHANFLQNLGKATQSDMLSLARKIAKKVEAKFGVRLESEVKIYDEYGEIIDFWRFSIKSPKLNSPRKMDTDFVGKLLTVQESQVFECKRASVQPGKALEAIIALANTNGGTLVLGLEDSKKAVRKDRIIGIKNHSDNISEVLKLAQKDIMPPLGDFLKNFEEPVVNIDGEEDTLSIFSIKKSNEVHSLRNGDTFVRRGDQNVKIGSEEIIRLKYEKGTLKFEEEISTVDTLNFMDPEIFGKYKDDNRGTMDDWPFLKNNGLAKEKADHLFLTRAGVLLFDQNPSVRLCGKYGIKITHYYGKKPSFSGAPNFVRRPFSIEGPLIIQIQKAVDYFREAVKNSPPKLLKSTFSPSILIPEWAFQEAITNAVIHRNYGIQDDIHVRFFDDRIEIESPGSYPGHITPQNIRTERFARNPLILRTLNRFSQSPNLDIGEGVSRMFEVMKEKNLYEPLYTPLSIRPHSVRLILFNLHKIEYWDIVVNYLEKHPYISNIDAREITGIKDTLKMSRLLKSWVEKGLLEKIGVSKKNTLYRRTTDNVVAPVFIFTGDENK